MAKIGSLGNVAFQVSASTIKTINNMLWSSSAKYATHERHGTTALTEFTGVDPEKITFDIELSVYLGVSPLTEIDKLRTYLRSGTAVSFVMGSRVYGQYRWTITALKVKAQGFDKNGDMERATVSVTLQEYLKS